MLSDMSHREDLARHIRPPYLYGAGKQSPAIPYDVHTLSPRLVRLGAPLVPPDEYPRAMGLPGVDWSVSDMLRCWGYRKYAPGDTLLEELEKAGREAKKGL